jgi:hypothetical protein
MILFDDRVAPNSPKQLKLLSIDVDLAMSLNKQWHSRLPDTVKGNLLRNRNCVFYGAFYANNYFASAIWTTPVAANRMKDGQNWLELRRLAIAPDSPKFTATWMISKMIKDIKKRFPTVHSLVSYQDTAVHMGTIYAAANWKLDQRSDKYVPWDNDNRKRTAKVQSDAPKNRWVYLMNSTNNMMN